MAYLKSLHLHLKCNIGDLSSFATFVHWCACLVIIDRSHPWSKVINHFSGLSRSASYWTLRLVLSRGQQKSCWSGNYHLSLVYWGKSSRPQWRHKVMAEVVTCCWTHSQTCGVSHAPRLCYFATFDLQVISHLFSLYWLFFQYILLIQAENQYPITPESN